MNIISYIEQIGDEAAAAEFGVAVVTARDWRRQKRRPRHEKAIEIAKLKGWLLDQVLPPKEPPRRKPYTRKAPVSAKEPTGQQAAVDRP